MPEELTPDICVIGGGPGGIAVATGAAALGVRVILVERGVLGGANLAHGGIPLAALVAAADHYEFLRRGPIFGVSGGPLQVDFAKVEEHIKTVVASIAARLSPDRFAALGVRVIAAAGRFADHRTLIAGNAIIRARRFVVAVGARAAPPAIPGLDGVATIGLDGAFGLTRRPAHLVVLGAGSRGLELAQAYRRLGVDATVVDEARALPEEDPELVEIVLDRLRADGILVRDGVKIAGIAEHRGGIRVTIAGDASGIPVDGSHLLVATGRAPAVEGLGLDEAGIMHDGEGITVDRTLRTTNRRVYAIGDAVAGPALANRAEYHAVRVLAAILYRLPVRHHAAVVPAVTFTDPTLASVGLTEETARWRYPAPRILRLPFVANDRAVAERLPAGLIKVVTTRRGRILGAAIVGHDAGELILPWSMALSRRLNIAAMRGFVPLYPTRGEIAVRLAAGVERPGAAPIWRRRLIGFLRRFG